MPTDSHLCKLFAFFHLTILSTRSKLHRQFRVFYFIQQPLVWDFVKCLGKVQVDDVHTIVIIKTVVTSSKNFNRLLRQLPALLKPRWVDLIRPFLSRWSTIESLIIISNNYLHIWLIKLPTRTTLCWLPMTTSSRDSTQSSENDHSRTLDHQHGTNCRRPYITLL